MAGIVNACTGANWAMLPIIQDPQVDEAALLREMMDRIFGEYEHTRLQATEFESGQSFPRQFLRSSGYNVETALRTWHDWVEWRHECLADEITDLEIRFELEEETLAWRGKSKQGWPCCVVTGRNMHPSTRKGSYSSFRKYLIRTVERGIKEADERGVEKVCVVYDRRGLEFQHLDPHLQNFLKPTLNQMQRFYGERLFAIYIVHCNSFMWVLYNLLAKPVASVLFQSGKDILVLDKASDLLEYFHEEDMPLLPNSEVDGNDVIFRSQSADSADSSSSSSIANSQISHSSSPRNFENSQKNIHLIEMSTDRAKMSRGFSLPSYSQDSYDNISNNNNNSSSQDRNGKFPSLSVQSFGHSADTLPEIGGAKHKKSITPKSANSTPRSSGKMEEKSKKSSADHKEVMVRDQLPGNSAQNSMHLPDIGSRGESAKQDYSRVPSHSISVRYGETEVEREKTQQGAEYAGDGIFAILNSFLGSGATESSKSTTKRTDSSIGSASADSRV